MREPLHKLATVTAEPMLPVAGVARAASASLLAADTYCPGFFSRVRIRCDAKSLVNHRLMKLLGDSVTVTRCEWGHSLRGRGARRLTAAVRRWAACTRGCSTRRAGPSRRRRTTCRTRRSVPSSFRIVTSRPRTRLRLPRRG